MSWTKQLAELARRRRMALQMGGAEKLARQKSRGKLNARERLSRLLDNDSFREIGALAGKGRYSENGDLVDVAPSNFIFGRGEIAGRTVVATADDFTVRGGAADAAIYRKFVQAEQMAHELRLPIIRMIDGTGGGGSVKMLEDMGFTYVPYVPGWEHLAQNQKSVPVVALALGPTAGLGAARVVASDYSVMVKGLSQIFTAGPAVVAALGEQHDKEGLGGSDIHTRNGVVDDEANSEDDAVACARRFLSYLPDYAGGTLTRIDTIEPLKGSADELAAIVPEDKRKAYNMRRILERVVDGGSLFEIGARWGGGVITALARINGWPVAVLASDPMFMAGSWTADGSQKAKRFLGLAEKFGLPVVNFVDNPGFMIGLEAERAATIRHGVEAMNAVYAASVPWATVIIRKAYGVAGAAMSNHSRYQYRFAWPSGDWGSLPIDGGVEVAYRAELETADDYDAALAAIKDRLSKVTSPFRTAEQFLVEDIIDPRETRDRLVEFVNLTVGRGCNGRVIQFCTKLDILYKIDISDQEEPVMTYNPEYTDSFEISTSDLRANLSDIIDRVITLGGRVTVLKHGKPQVAIVNIADLAVLERGLKQRLVELDQQLDNAMVSEEEGLLLEDFDRLKPAQSGQAARATSRSEDDESKDEANNLTMLNVVSNTFLPAKLRGVVPGGPVSPGLPIAASYGGVLDNVVQQHLAKQVADAVLDQVSQPSVMGIMGQNQKFQTLVHDTIESSIVKSLKDIENEN